MLDNQKIWEKYHYFSFYKLLKHIASILKLKANYTDRIKDVKHIKVSLERLQHKDFEKTRIEVYKLCQLKPFGKEISFSRIMFTT